MIAVGRGPSYEGRMTLDADLVDIGELLKQKLEEAVKKVGRVNVVIAGRSGVGKSTLINEVFQGRLATTGLCAVVRDDD